jgi:hypothetical protein
MTMYMRTAPEGESYPAVRLAPAAAATVALSVAAVLVLGFWPRGVFDAALQSAGTLTQTDLPVAHH